MYMGRVYSLAQVPDWNRASVNSVRFGFELSRSATALESGRLTTLIYNYVKTWTVQLYLEERQTILRVVT